MSKQDRVVTLTITWLASGAIPSRMVCACGNHASLHDKNAIALSHRSKLRRLMDIVDTQKLPQFFICTTMSTANISSQYYTTEVNNISLWHNKYRCFFSSSFPLLSLSMFFGIRTKIIILWNNTARIRILIYTIQQTIYSVMLSDCKWQGILLCNTVILALSHAQLVRHSYIITKDKPTRYNIAGQIAVYTDQVNCLEIWYDTNPSLLCWYYDSYVERPSTWNSWLV